MNLTHCSRLTIAFAAVLVLLVGALGATAVPFDGDPPDSAQVGTEVDTEITMTEPYAVAEEWTMRVSTELQEARLTVTTLDGAGDPVDTIDRTQNSLVLRLNDSSISEVRFEIRGDVPEIGGDGPGEYNYENRAQENITVLQIQETFSGQVRTVENGTFELHRFTPNSQDARQAIDSAMTAAEEADSDNARNRIDEAITFYNNAEFGEAVDAANEAEETADSGGSRTTLILVGAVIAVLVVVGGVAYYLRSRQEPANKLQ
jgi:hypothetical protein